MFTWLFARTAVACVAGFKKRTSSPINGHQVPVDRRRGVFLAPGRPARARRGAIPKSLERRGQSRERNEVRRYVWVALTAVAVSLAIVGFAHVSGTSPSYSFLLTDWIRRPDMVSQCMIRLNRDTNPQDQDVWKAMGVKDPATLPYFGRLRYCYEGFWAWQRALQPQSG
jgi:hypothetical protein